MRLEELYRTGYERQAMDGRRAVERCTTTRLVRNIRKDQISATYVWTLPIIQANGEEQ